MATAVEIAVRDGRTGGGAYTSAAIFRAAGLTLGTATAWIVAALPMAVQPVFLLACAFGAAGVGNLLQSDQTRLPYWRFFPRDQEHELLDRCAAIQEVSALTYREADILYLLAKGLNAAVVADAMSLSPHTVKTHMKHIYARMGVHTQQEIISTTQGGDEMM